MKSMPRTCHASTGMFKQNVKIEYHFDVRGTIGRKWTYEDINEDTITLRQKLRKIPLSPKSLLKMKVRKL